MELKPSLQNRIRHVFTCEADSGAHSQTLPELPVRSRCEKTTPMGTARSGLTRFTGDTGRTLSSLSTCFLSGFILKGFQSLSNAERG